MNLDIHPIDKLKHPHQIRSSCSLWLSQNRLSNLVLRGIVCNIITCLPNGGIVADESGDVTR